MLGEARLNFEEFSTVLTQVEACLNSRPLTPLSEAVDTIEELTPGHFLIGRPLAALPEETEGLEVRPLRQWQLCQNLVRNVWTQWSREYLNTLNKSYKWNTETRDYRVGDIVCLREEPTAPTRWPLAKVIKIHPGQDVKDRIVTVRTAKGTYVRPAVKLVPLIQGHE